MTSLKSLLFYTTGMYGTENYGYCLYAW